MKRETIRERVERMFLSALRRPPRASDCEGEERAIKLYKILPVGVVAANESVVRVGKVTGRDFSREMVEVSMARWPSDGDPGVGDRSARGLRCVPHADRRSEERDMIHPHKVIAALSALKAERAAELAAAEAKKARELAFRKIFEPKHEWRGCRPTSTTRPSRVPCGRASMRTRTSSSLPPDTCLCFRTVR